jgi:uncharacterized membrane protein YbhN (UPF0104 family)
VISRSTVSWVHVAASTAGLAVLVALAATPQLLGSRVEESLSGLGAAHPLWLWTAGAGFLSGLLCSALAWHAAATASGGRLTRRDATARYATGSLVNSLAPAHLGDAVRVALFARALEGSERVWMAGGIYAAMGAARCLTLALLVIATSLSGALPIWPVFVLVGVAAFLGVVAYVERNDRTHRFARIFRVLAAIESSPRAAAKVLGWTAGSTLARLCAVTSIALALDVPHPVMAALVIFGALAVSNIFPLTPGNLGITSGAVAVALQARGIDMRVALSSGIALGAVETLVGLTAGAVGALYLGRFSATWAVRFAAAGASIVIAGAVGYTLFDIV